MFTKYFVISVDQTDNSMGRVIHVHIWWKGVQTDSMELVTVFHCQLCKFLKIFIYYCLKNQNLLT